MDELVNVMVVFLLFLLLIGGPVYLFGLVVVLPCVVLLASLYMAIRGFIRDELDLYYVNRRAKEVVEEARDLVRDRTHGAPA
jgi:hypothetical protein